MIKDDLDGLSLEDTERVFFETIKSLPSDQIAEAYADLLALLNKEERLLLSMNDSNDIANQKYRISCIKWSERHLYLEILNRSGGYSS